MIGEAGLTIATQVAGMAAVLGAMFTVWHTAQTFKLNVSDRLTQELQRRDDELERQDTMICELRKRLEECEKRSTS